MNVRYKPARIIHRPVIEVGMNAGVRDFVTIEQTYRAMCSIYVPKESIHKLIQALQEAYEDMEK